MDSRPDVNTDETTEEEHEEEWLSKINPDIVVDLRKAFLGGLLAAVVAMGGSSVVGSLYGAEGRLLLEAMLPTTRFLCSAMMTATATILALMLTILSLSSNSSNRLHSFHYKRVHQIAILDMVAFVGATLLLLFLNIPLEESDSISTEWYSTTYYVVLIYSSVLGGMLISIVMMLHAAIRDMISVVGLQDEEHPLYQEES